ncbi:MAG: hypothetical protein AB7J35_02035 [Dehalococcoidia bacterium]
MAANDPETQDLLNQILREKFPKVRSRVALVGLSGLDAHVRRQLTEAFADELQRTGFDSQWKRNARGLALEALIDLVCINDEPAVDEDSAG